ncbi:beta-glucosidase 6 [Iris pallida]|uniref:Beta-glucosidase 6 n=1 Tax=Iris pallida TaxID=29817 RepID=A0AAX6F9Q5_IRIPA|nr:beta-glucosidase 6 [Iris pallida]
MDLTTLAIIDQHRMTLTLHVLIGSVIGLGDEAFHSDATCRLNPSGLQMWRLHPSGCILYPKG